MYICIAEISFELINLPIGCYIIVMYYWQVNFLIKGIIGM